MINLRRLPGVFFNHKRHAGFLLFFVVSGYLTLHRLGLVCTNSEIKNGIETLCRSHKAGKAMGSLCIPLCVKKEIHSVSCIAKPSKKQSVFTAKWNKRQIVIKSSKEHQSSRKVPRKEKEFEDAVRVMVSEKLNLTLTPTQLKDLKYLQGQNKFSSAEQREIERENILSLLESQEYLLLRLFPDSDIFPQLVGTCGHFYGVEYLETPAYNSLFTLDDKAEWSERMKLAIAIMDFVEEVETDFPDALYLCDIRMSHLGVASTGQIKYLDLDLVFMKNVIDRMLRSGRRCTTHKDCDFHDCKSTCNLEENICDGGVVSDNLQVICEKIFIGWTMSGKMLVPGLLMSEHTPASLSALLRLCAENVRQPMHEDLRQRLYTTLTEMHQILVQKLAN